MRSRTFLDQVLFAAVAIRGRRAAPMIAFLGLKPLYFAPLAHCDT